MPGTTETLASVPADGAALPGLFPADGADAGATAPALSLAVGPGLGGCEPDAAEPDAAEPAVAGAGLADCGLDPAGAAVAGLTGLEPAAVGAELAAAAAGFAAAVGGLTAAAVELAAAVAVVGAAGAVVRAAGAVVGAAGAAVFSAGLADVVLAGVVPARVGLSGEGFGAVAAARPAAGAPGGIGAATVGRLSWDPADSAAAPGLGRSASPPGLPGRPPAGSGVRPDAERAGTVLAGPGGA